MTTDDAAERCPLCRGRLVEKKLKKFCEQCGQLCETCCDNGCSQFLKTERALYKAKK